MDTTLYLGDCLDVMRSLPAGSCDALVTDPPAGISFMGKEWDDPSSMDSFPLRDRGELPGGHTPQQTPHKHGHGFARGMTYEHSKRGRDAFVAFLAPRLAEARRLLRPGTFALIWALPRTSHWTALAIEEAGFVIRDRVGEFFSPESLWAPFVESLDDAQRCQLERLIGGLTVSRLAACFGSGFPKSRSCLKPAVEDWWLCKAPGPLRELGIDGCRVAAEPWTKTDGAAGSGYKTGKFMGIVGRGDPTHADGPRESSAGRWPPNLALSHVGGPDGCRRAGTRRVKGSNDRQPADPNGEHRENREQWRFAARTTNYAGPDGTEVVEAWECVEGCPVAALDAMSGERKAAYGNQVSADAKTAEGKACNGQHNAYGKGLDTKPMGHVYSDRGGASRFFPQFAPDPEPFGYFAKASRADRHRGCEHLLWRRDPARPSGYAPIGRDDYESLPEKERARGNIHSTVKANSLMRWLIRLVCPPGGVALDPFAGSGSTLVAAIDEGFGVVGMESDPDYHLIARTRTGSARASLAAETPLFGGTR
jgi:DNA modification methylase